MLISETVEMLLNPSKAGEARDHLRFILQISNQRWFEDNFEIFRSELKVWSKRQDYHFLSPSQERLMKIELTALTNGGSFTSEVIDEITAGNTITRAKTKRMKRIGAQMRQSVSDTLRYENRSPKDIHESWEDVLSRGLIKLGTDLITKQAYHTKFLKWVTHKRWKRNPSGFSFFMDWVTGILYMQYYAMKYQNEPLDKNAQSDIQHLLYLRIADGIVSEDQKFMKKAWGELYKARGKQYYSVADLCVL